MSDIIELKLGKECLLASRDGLNNKQIDYMFGDIINNSNLDKETQFD